MPPEVLDLILFTGDNGLPIVALEEKHYSTLVNLLQGVPALKEPGQIASYCAAVNHLKHGHEYRLIVDPDGYRARYLARLNAEPIHQPIQGNAVRLRQFGLCDTSSLQPPRREPEGVVFFVEDRFLGIPYRVTAPDPDHPEGGVDYDPLPMTPLPGSLETPPMDEPPGPVAEEFAAEEAEPVPPTPNPKQLIEEPPELDPLPQGVEPADVAKVVAVPPAPTVKPAPVAPPPAVSPSVPASTQPVAAVGTPPPPPSPLELLHDALTREDQAAVQQHLLTLGVDKKVCERLLAAWQSIVAPYTLAKERQAKMQELIAVIRPLTALRKVQDELWRLQRALTRCT